VSGGWRRLKEWNANTDRRFGYRFDDPKKTPEENIANAMKKRQNWGRPPIVVPAEDYMSFEEATRVFKKNPRRGPRNLRMLIARGLVQHCFVPDGREGVTRSSVADEIEWRRTADLWTRFKRAAGGVLHWV